MEKDEPIVINLSEDLESSYQKALIRGDPRLLELDAFLHTLNDTLNEQTSSKIDQKFNYFIARLAKQLNEEKTINKVDLEITSTLSPKTNSITYKFKFNITPG
jgi:hypothetical protein